jgi:fused signal recognition particle receptor
VAFFKKLKDRLFKSSSKIEDGLDAIVGDGGVEEEVEAQVDVAAQVAAEAAEKAEAEAAKQAARAETERLAQEAAAAEAAQAQRQREEDAREAARIEQEHAAELARVAEQERLAHAAALDQAARDAAELAAAERAAAEAAAAEAEREAQAFKEQAEAQAAKEAQEAADDAVERARLHAQETERLEAARAAELERQEQAAAAAEQERQAAAAREAEAAERAEQARLAEDARRAEEEQQAHEAKLAQEARAADAAREMAEAEARAHADRPAAALHADDARRAEDARLAEAQKAEAAAAKPGLLGRLLGRGEKKTVVRRELDDDMLEQLEELLISADMGVDTALRVTANMAEGRFGKRLSTQEIKELLAAEVTRIMEPVARPMPLYPTKPQVVLVVGVNGSGKTTTIGKLASQVQAAGKKVVIAAGDTFRAAAVEQLQVWGDRAGVPVLTAPEGSDPASLAFDAREQAGRDGADLLMIDTAGRLQNRADLMEELSKIVRVIRKKDPDAPHNTLLVLDATTGQNALSQVKTFQELADVSGLVMTKLDGTAKGGVLVALADKFGLPIHAIGVGEQIDDLAPFDPEEFADALIGLDR